MLHEMLTAALHQNQFASGGMLLMALGAIGASLRKMPAALWGHLLNQTTMTFTITDEQDSFKWFKRWFAAQDAAKKIRRVDMFIPWSNKENKFVTLMTPAPGSHWLWRRGVPMHITLTRSEEKQHADTRAEKFTIQMPGRNNLKLKALMEEMMSIHAASVEKAPSLWIYSGSNSGWTDVEGYAPRKMDTVILPREIKESALADLVKFRGAKDWYVERGIPYRRGYLFYGTPGSGKTSLINGLAAHLNLGLRVVSLSGLGDKELARAVGYAGKDTVIVLEDIDCAKATASRIPKNKDAPDAVGGVAELMGVTLSGLLNVLDGLATPSGALFFMTTNHVEKLDPALLRAGRCDVKLCFGDIQEEQKLEMYKKFFGGTLENAKHFIEYHPATSASEFQEALVQYAEEHYARGASAGD